MLLQKSGALLYSLSLACVILHLWERDQHPSFAMAWIYEQVSRGRTFVLGRVTALDTGIPRQDIDGGVGPHLQIVCTSQAMPFVLSLESIEDGGKVPGDVCEDSESFSCLITILARLSSELRCLHRA